MQFDEKWSFVGKKEKNCSEAEQEKGEQWDYVAIDAESRLVLSVVVGKRTPENCQRLVDDVYQRTGSRDDVLLSSDCFSSYRTAIENTYGKKIIPERRKGPGRNPKNPVTIIPEKLCYVTVCKEYKKGSVSSIKREIVFGNENLLHEKLINSKVGNTINTAFVERNNGTDRMQNSRKVRETYGFSKDYFFHLYVTIMIFCLYNFCWCIRTLSFRDNGRSVNRTPAMAAGLETHIWTIEEWITYPVYDRDIFCQINNYSYHQTPKKKKGKLA